MLYSAAAVATVPPLSLYSKSTVPRPGARRETGAGIEDNASWPGAIDKKTAALTLDKLWNKE